MSLENEKLLILKKATKDTALMGIDIPKNHLPNSGFEDLPEYQRAVDAINNYVEAVGRYDGVILGRKKWKFIL